MTEHQTKYDRLKANTIKWFKRSNPEAWFRLNMGPIKWDAHLKELAKQRRMIAKAPINEEDEN